MHISGQSPCCSSSGLHSWSIQEIDFGKTRKTCVEILKGRLHYVSHWVKKVNPNTRLSGLKRRPLASVILAHDKPFITCIDQATKQYIPPSPAIDSAYDLYIWTACDPKFLPPPLSLETFCLGENII